MKEVFVALKMLLFPFIFCDSAKSSSNFPQQFGFGHQGVELAGARVVEFDVAVGLAADEGIEVEVGAGVGQSAGGEGVGGLQDQRIVEGRIDAVAAGKTHWVQQGRAGEDGQRG